MWCDALQWKIHSIVVALNKTFSSPDHFFDIALDRSLFNLLLGDLQTRVLLRHDGGERTLALGTIGTQEG